MKFWIPNAVTLCGAFAALLSLLWAPAHPYWACNALIAASLFDMVDGRIARMLGAQSAIGQQLDSLVDVIAFGVAPAYLAYASSLHTIQSVSSVPLGIIPMFIFVACSAVRLAIFNAQSDSDSQDSEFSGIPTPVAALLVITSIMAWHEMKWSPFGETWFLATIMVSAALLMVLPLPFQSFKSFKSRVAKFSYFGAMVGGVTLLVLRLPGGTVLFGFVSLYVLRGLGAALLSSRASTQ
jgi:CDP-diacylglycerol--serine O-phosphatidyltransferase